MRRSSSLHTIDDFVQRKLGNDKYQDVVAVADSIDVVTLVSNSLTPISTVATDIADVKIVAWSITDVNTVGAAIADVTSVASNIADITSVAAEVVPNMAELLLVNDNAAAVASLYDQFDDRYLGSKISAPTLDNDGNPLLVGAIYWNSAVNTLFVWTGTIWDNLITTSSTSSLTNKTLNNYTNDISANRVHYRAKATEVIAKGQAVIVTGYNQGADALEVRLADQTVEVATGLAAENIPTGSLGMIVKSGELVDLDTSLFLEGSILYVNGTGVLTTTRPSTGYEQPIAYVLRSNSNNGVLLVNADYPLQDANDVRYDATLTGLTATTIQDAVDEVELRLDTAETKLAGIEAGATADQLASEVPVIPAGNIAATNVQAALEELDSEKLGLATGGIIDADLTITGNLAVQGTTFTVDSTTVTTADNMIVINNGEAGTGVTAGDAGLEVDRGLATNYQFKFDELDDSFKIGEIGSLQKVATREDAPVDTGIAVWDATTSKFTTTKTPTVDGLITAGLVDGRDVSVDGTKLDGIESGATADQTGAEIKTLYEAELDTNAYTDAEKLKLAGIESGAQVNDVNTTLQGNIFNGANQLVQLDALGALPALDGSALTGVSSVGSIDDLTDVDTTTTAPVTNDVLKWDGANWVPGVGGATPVTVFGETKVGLYRFSDGIDPIVLGTISSVQPLFHVEGDFTSLNANKITLKANKVYRLEMLIRVEGTDEGVESAGLSVRDANTLTSYLVTTSYSTNTSSGWAEFPYNTTTIKPTADVEIEVIVNSSGAEIQYANSYLRVIEVTYTDVLPEQIGYSTNEQLTGKRWIDGKPIYRTTLPLVSLPNSTTKTWAHNISNVDTIWLGGESWVYDDVTSLDYRPLLGNGDFWRAWVDSTQVGVTTSLNGTDWDGYAIIEYTKTTDTASTTITTKTASEVYLEGIDYSTTEVLTDRRWTDGKPIYRRNATVTTAVISTWYQANLVDVDNIVSVEPRMHSTANDVYLGDGRHSSDVTDYYSVYFNGTSKDVFVMATHAAFVGTTHDIICEYTKTTDTAFSPVAKVLTNADPFVKGTENSQKFIATEGQTDFVVTKGFTDGYLNVFMNGILLENTEYTTTQSTGTVSLNVGATLNDIIYVQAFGTFTIAAEPNTITTEYDTGMKRGGKTVYGMEVDFGAMPNSTTKNVAIPSYNATYTYWFSNESYGKSTTNNSTIPIPRAAVVNSSNVDIWNNDGVISITTGIDWSLWNAKIVLHYTK